MQVQVWSGRGIFPMWPLTHSSLHDTCDWSSHATTTTSSQACNLPRWRFYVRSSETRAINIDSFISAFRRSMTPHTLTHSHTLSLRQSAIYSPGTLFRGITQVLDPRTSPSGAFQLAISSQLILRDPLPNRTLIRVLTSTPCIRIRA